MKKDDVSEMSRRTFLAAVSAAASAPLLGAATHQELAVEGGKPVRSTTLTTHYEGANFIDDSIVEFDGVPVTTAPVQCTLLRETKFYPVYTQLLANVPGSLLSKFASYKVMVKNPKPEGGLSNVLNFFIAP